MSKQNDFIAALLRNPTAESLEDFYAHGIRPDNTGIKDRDEYKNIKFVREHPNFIDKEGNFSEKNFNEYYDSALRVFNEFQNRDFIETAVNTIEESTLDWTNLNGKKYDSDAIVHLENLPNKYTSGLSNIWEIGTPTFSDAEIAQTKKVLDENGNELDYTPNDKGGVFKGILREPMALDVWEEDGVHTENGIEVAHKKGELRLDDEGDARYKLIGNKSSAGKQLLNYWDTITMEGSWINKYDFMDSDGMRKSVAGVVAKTAFQIIPYFIPYVGSVYKYLMAAKELGTAMPMFLQSINTAFGGEENDEFGQSMNAWSNKMLSYRPGMSQRGQSNFFSLENIGNIIADSLGQVYEFRAIGNIPKLLKQTGKIGTNIGWHSGLAYMALTSGQDSYNTFKEAGASDQVAGIGALGTMGALYALMPVNYFKDWLLKGTWLDENRILNETLRETINNKKAVWKFINESGKTISKNQAQKIFNTVKSAVGNTWNKLFTVAGTSGRGISEILGRSFNEGIEETAEELASDVVKGLFLGIEALGADMTGANDKLDFGFSTENIATRYGGAFVGGAIGGAVFEGVDKAERLFKGGKSLISLDTKNRLLWFLRNGQGKQIRDEINRLYKKGKLGNKNLSATKSVNLEDVLKSGDGNIVTAFQEGTDTDNQNLLIYRAMMAEIDALEHFLNSNQFLYSDKELAQKVLGLYADPKALSESKKNLENPLINKIIELGLTDSVTDDVQYLLTQLENKSVQIAAKQKELSKSIPDGANKDIQINTNQELVNLRSEYNSIKQALDEILSGQHADYYVEYGLSLVDKEFNKYFTPGDESIAYSDIANYYWLNTGKQFSNLSEEEKNAVKVEYDSFKALTGYSSKRQRFELFRNVNQRYSDIISKSNDELKTAKYDPEFSAEIYGDLDEKLSKNNKRLGEINLQLETIEDEGIRESLIEEKRQLENDNKIYSILSKNASLERVRIQAANVPSISKYERYQHTINEQLLKLDELNKQLANQGETPDITVIANLTSQIEEATNEIEKLNNEMINLRDQVKAEVLGYYNDMAVKKIVKFDNDVILETVIPYLISTKVSDSQLKQNVLNNGEISHHINDYRQFITNITNNPFGFNNYYNDLISKLTKESEEFDIPESTVKTVVSKMLNNLDVELSEFLEQIKLYKSQLPKTPLDKIVQDLHVQIAGRPLQILEMLNMEKERYLAAKRVDEYVLSHGDQQAKEIDAALRLLNLITASVDAASNGYNIEANKFRKGDKKIKLAEITNNVAEIYKNEILTLKQRLEYLKALSAKNNAAQSKKQFDIMLNVEPKLVASILKRKDEINKEFGIDIEKIWNDSKGDVSLDGLTLETHPAFKDAKIEFEKNVFTELNGKFNKKQFAEKIFNIFESDSNLWTCKSGEFNDSMDEFSPYVEMLYLTSFITSNTYDFSCKWNEKVLQNEAYSKYTPFYSQEFTIRSVWSQMKNGEVYNELLNLLKTQVPEDEGKSTYLAEMFTAKNIVFVTGGPGTGKSSAVGLAIKLLAEAENGKALGIAKFEQQVKGLQDNLQIHENESILFSDFESKITDNPINLYDNDVDRLGHISRLNDIDLSQTLDEFENISGPKILVVDEFTFFTEGEIQFLSKYAEKHNILIVGLGDPKQNQTTISQSGKNAQTGFEDTIMFMTPALTISMRVGNAAQELNNTKLDTILSKCINYTKDHRSESVKAWNKGMKSEGIIPKNFEFTYSDDSDGFFGTVYQTHTPESKLDIVKNWIQKLKASGKTVALITDDKAFDSLASVVDKIIDPFNVQGAEFDYVIVAKQNWDTLKLGHENNAFLFLRDLLTMSSRAKVGSVILADEKQTPFKNLVAITSSQSPAGKIIVNSETDARFTEIKQKYNDYIKGIYAKYVSESETSDDKSGEDIPPTSGTQTGEVLPMNDNNASEVPPTEDVDLQTVLDAYENELTDETVKYVRKSDYKKYQDRKAELAEGGFAHADTDQFITHLYDGTIDLFKKGSLLEGLPVDFEDESGKELLQSYREYLQAVSSIIMYRPKDAQLTKAIEFANNKLDSSELFITEYLGKVENILRNLDEIGYFYVTELDTDKQLVYYVTENIYIPINVVDKMTPGLYKNIKFSESIGVIGLSSNGTLHNDVKETNSNHVYQSSQGGIFAPDDNTRRELRNDNEDFNLANIGKSAIYVTYKPWLTPNEVFRFNVNEIGIRDYTISHQHEVKLVDIQKRIDFQTFINLCKHRKFILRGTEYADPNSSASTDKNTNINISINTLKSFLNLSESDVSLLRAKPPKDEVELYKKWTEVAYGSTQILTNQSLNHLISVLINYYLSQNNDVSDQVLNNILEYIKTIGGYRSNINPHKYNTKGFSIRLYKSADDRPNHSYYDDFFFKCVDVNGDVGEYVVYKNTWDDDIKDGEYYEIDKTFSLTLDIDKPIDTFVQALNIVCNTYSDSDNKPRLFESTNEITLESFSENLAEHNFSIILGTKSDTYESPLLTGESPSGNKVSTTVWPMIDFDVVGELLKGVNLDDTTELENYFKNDSMFKNNFYVSMKGGEYYSVENGMNNFKVSAHKKLPLSKNISSDYVKFIAPLFRINDYNVVTDESERAKFKYLDLDVEKVEEPVITEPILYTSSAFKITGSSKSIKVDNGTTSMLATVVAMTDSEMWIDCPLFRSPVSIKGEWKGKVPKPIMNREFAFKTDDLYFFKESNGLFVSSDSTSGAKNNWLPLNGGLFDIVNGTFIDGKDLPMNINRFGLHVSDNLKIDQNGNVVDGEISINNRFAQTIIPGLNSYKSIKVTKLDFPNSQLTLNVDGEIIERFVIDIVSDLKQLFGLTDSHFIKSNAFADIDLFKTKAKRLLSTHALNEYSDSIISLIGEDIDSSLLQINQFLNDIRLEVGAEYSMIWDKNKVKIGKTDTHETTVAGLLNQNKTSFKSIIITNTDGDINICDLIEFSVTLSDDSIRTGFVTRKNGQWELKLQIESESADVNVETLIFDTLNPETDGLLISQLMQIVNEIRETGTSDTYSDSVDMLADQRLDSIMDAIDQLLKRDDNCNIIK